MSVDCEGAAVIRNTLWINDLWWFVAGKAWGRGVGLFGVGDFLSVERDKTTLKVYTPMSQSRYACFWRTFHRTWRKVHCIQAPLPVLVGFPTVRAVESFVGSIRFTP